MKTHFFCPKCHGYLSVGNRVIFTIKKKNLDLGLLLLNPKLGEYTYEYHPSMKIDEGEEIEFFCPMCGYELTYEGANNLVKIRMSVDDNEAFWVIFSKKKGERCTYKIAHDGSKEHYGEHADPNIDFSNLAQLK